MVGDKNSSLCADEEEREDDEDERLEGLSKGRFFGSNDGGHLDDL